MEDKLATKRALTVPTWCAMAIGLYLAWWNQFHDEGFLFLDSLSSQVASCVACYGGIFLAAALMLGLKGHASPTKRSALAVALGQFLCGAAFYASVEAQLTYAVVGLQAAQGLLTFIAVLWLLPRLSGLSLPQLPRNIAIALVSYALAECAGWLASFAIPGLLMRLAIHGLLWIGATILGYQVLLGRRHGQVSASEETGAFVPLPPLPFPLLLSAGAYWLVFGMTHALASGIIPMGHNKLLLCYGGSLAAGMLFLLVFGSMQSGDKIWPKMRLCIFPLAMLSFLLLAFANSALTFVSISFAQCAMDTYLAFYAFSFFIIARKLHCPVLQVASIGAIIAVPAVIVGVVAGDSLKVLVALTPQFYNALSIIAFILLVAGTFWVGDDRRISLVWGLEKKLTPKRFEDDAIAERCAKATKRFGLTKREGEILVFLAHGQNAAAIADDQVISVNTVRTHIARIHRKMHVSNQRELVARLEEE